MVVILSAEQTVLPKARWFCLLTHPGGDTPIQDAVYSAGVEVPEHRGIKRVGIKESQLPKVEKAS